MSGQLARVVAWNPLTREIADILFDTLVNLVSAIVKGIVLFRRSPDSRHAT